MSKRVLFLSFYFEPDLCAGSFRNSPLAYELARQGLPSDITIDVISTLPNRYSTYSHEAQEYEKRSNISITRVKIPVHQSGIKDQIISYKTYFAAVNKLVKEKKYDLVYASSSRLFTAYLGYRIAKSQDIPLYLDIRDIFVDTIKDVFPNPLVKKGVLPLMSYIESKTFNYATHINLISGGFREYFQKFKNPQFTEFSNGIDPVFLNSVQENERGQMGIKTIVYAGNLGEGQGLHRIVPEAAKLLGPSYKFRIIGDGGAKGKLIESIRGLENVEVIPPVQRAQLIEEYNKATFLFMHLNDYEAFKKVLPSKVFELGVFKKPLIAGVNGYSRAFVAEHLPDSILIEPCNGSELATKVKEYDFFTVSSREIFKSNFKRENINNLMAKSILQYLLCIR